MYLTQGSYFGKTGPIDPQRTIPENPPQNERTYPNRWMEERNLKQFHQTNTSFGSAKQPPRGRSEMTEGLNIHNQKYLDIVKMIIEPNHVWKLLKWLDTISEQHKRGLRVIKAVIDMRGQKRFKKIEGTAQKDIKFDFSAFDVKNFDADKAKSVFRKMTNQTSYRTQFGEPPKAAEDFLVLKQKNLKDLEISKYLQPQASNYLEKWLKINDQDEFTGRIFFTLRELFTVVKNLEAPNLTYSQFFTGRKADKVPRFDKILLAAKHGDRLKSVNQPKAASKSLVEQYYPDDRSFARTSMRRPAPPLINTKQFKQEFLRGQPFNITDFVELKNIPMQTSYQSAMHGQPCKDKAQIVDFERTSAGIGGLIPDPSTMLKNDVRLNNFSTDLNTMTGKFFTYTGDSWNK